MALTLTPMTEIEAVNAMLEMIGSSPVSSLPDSGVTSAYLCRSILHRKSREIQSPGHSFNEDTKYSMSPNVDGHILVADNVIRIDPFYDYQRFVERYDTNDSKRKLYDQENHTFIFSTAVLVDVVWFVSWNALPSYARDYIYVAAGREFQKKFQSSDLIHSLTEEDEIRARTEFFSAEYRASDDTILTSPGCFDIVNRRA